MERDYVKEGMEAFQNTDMEKAAWCYFQAAQHATILREQLTHLSNYFFCLHYLPHLTPEQITQQISIYDNLFHHVTPFTSYEDKKEIIRIGYISADFRQHAMANFIRPLLKNFNNRYFEIVVYCLNEPDCITEEFQGYNVVWRQVNNISPAELAEQIHDDGVTILVDLCGHTHGGLTLMTLSHKPAPIQISGLGWLSTTGLSTTDFFLTDRYSVNNNSVHDLYVEKLLTVPTCQLCYDSIGELPAIERNCSKNTIFGSYSNFDKINDELLLIWQKILKRVPNSQLILKDTTVMMSRRQAMINRLLKLGFSVGEDVLLESADEDYLRSYNRIDIALDTFPYTGGATVCDALSMGVPVISLAGDCPSRRLGSSILHYAGFSKYIAANLDDYVEKSVALAKEDIDHQDIRTRFLSSDVSNSKKYMNELEIFYRNLCKTL